MEKIATDIYTFSRLREEGFTYVDKTVRYSALFCAGGVALLGCCENR